MRGSERSELITRSAAAVALAVGVPTVAWLVWRSLGWPLVHDAPLMHYVAWRISEGAVPYRDLFDMNFPGVYLLHLAVVTTVGTGDAAWRAVDLGWLALTGALVGTFVAPWGRPAATAAALLFALYHLAGGAWQAGQRDFLLCAFLLAGVLGVTRWLECPAAGVRARVPLAYGGLAMGASVVLKPHAAALAAGLAALIALAAWRGNFGLVASVSTFVAGALVVPAAIGVWLGAAGALPAWRAIVLDYLLPLYSRLGRGAAWSVYRPEAWLALGAGALMSVASALAAGRFAARHAVATLGVAYGLVHFVAQGKGWEYHLYPLATFVIVLLFADVEPVLAGRRPVAVPLLVTILLAAGLLTAKAAEASATRWERDKAALVRGLAAEMAPRLTPGDTVQVLDTTGGGIHALLSLGVVQPTRFLYDFHFFHDLGHPTIAALRGELLRGLDARPPRLMVVFEEGWPAGGYERLRTFAALEERLAGYDLVRSGAGYRIYAQPHRP
jgi:hypothetical protein